MRALYVGNSCSARGLDCERAFDRGESKRNDGLEQKVDAPAKDTGLRKRTSLQRSDLVYAKKDVSAWEAR